MLPKWFTPIVVATIASLSVWLLSYQEPKLPETTTREVSVPDTFMENFTTRIMNTKGVPTHQLRAAYMAHYPYDDHSDFTSPQFTIYRPSGEQWIVSAEKGTSEKGTEKILLHGEVIMTRQLTPTAEVDLEIRTRDLIIQPDNAFAETNQPITITRGESVLQSDGVRAFFDEGRVELLSRVRGRYVL